MSRSPRYQFRIPAMGLVMIVATFLLMVLGAVPLAAGLDGGEPSMIVVGVGTLGLTAWLFVRAARVSVVVSPDGLLVRNLLRTHRIGWSQVADIRPQAVPAPGGIGSPQIVLSLGVVDPNLTRVRMLATRTAAVGSGVRLFPLLAVLDVHAAADGFTIVHHLPDGTALSG